ncbi:MAG: hypothetical protein AAGA30_17045, partial [Planctomycetota bacterium]
MLNNDYFQFLPKNLTFVESRRMCQTTIELLTVVILKIFRIPITIPTAFRYPNDLIMVSGQAVPTHIRDRFSRDLSELKRHEMQSEFAFKLQTIGNMEIFGWSGVLQQEPVMIKYLVTR